MSLFRPATRQKVKLRMAVDGVSGSGKTFSALRFATALGKRIAVINTESGAVEKYLGLAPDGIPFQFDVCELADYSPTKYTETILAAGKAGYDVLIIDSLSHAWAGAGGALELKDRKGGNSFTAWKDITPMHNQMIEAILHSPCHVIATMRSKTEYVLESDSHGRSVPRKMGMAPVQRAGMEYEFDLYCSIDSEHIMRVSKSRCPEVAGALTVKPGVSFMEPVVAWLNDGSSASADKFAVTEDDLKRLAKVESADIPPPPKKTAQELMAEAAAKVKGTPATEVAQSVETGVASSPEAAPPPLAEQTADTIDGLSESTKTQRERIEALFAALSVPPEVRQAILRKRGVSVLRSLNHEQAEEIIARLSEKANELARAATGDDNQGESQAGVMSADVDSPATDQQVAAIKAALIEAEQSKAGITAEFVARLNGAGFAKVANLSFGQARNLIAAIESENIIDFFDSMLETAAAG